jgi:hypothetical protein
MFSAESPSARLLQLASGFRITQALYVVAKLGVADLLVSGPRSCEEVACEVGAHPESLFRVMRALASLGVFTQDSSDSFGLNPMSSLLLKDTPGSVRAAVIFWGGEMYRAAGELMHSVKTGETAFNHIYGEGHFEYLSKNPEANLQCDPVHFEYGWTPNPPSDLCPESRALTFGPLNILF